MVRSEAQREQGAKGVLPLKPKSENKMAPSNGDLVKPKTEKKMVTLDVKVGPCLLGNECKVRRHYHAVLSEGKPRPKPGAEARIAGKYALCKPTARLELCDMDFECPSRDTHYHPRIVEKKGVNRPSAPPQTPQDKVEEATRSSETKPLIKAMEKKINDPQTRADVMEDCYTKKKVEAKIQTLVLPTSGGGIPEVVSSYFKAEQKGEDEGPGEIREAASGADQPPERRGGGDGGDRDGDQPVGGESDSGSDVGEGELPMGADGQDGDHADERAPAELGDRRGRIERRLALLQHNQVDYDRIVIYQNENGVGFHEPMLNQPAVERAHEDADLSGDEDSEGESEDPPDNQWLRVIPDKDTPPEEPFRYPSLKGDFEREILVWEKINGGEFREETRVFWSWLKAKYLDAYRSIFYEDHVVVPGQLKQEDVVFDRMATVYSDKQYKPKWFTRALFGKDFSRSQKVHYDTLDEGVFNFGRKVMIWNDLYVEISKKVGSLMAGNFVDKQVFMWNPARVLDEMRMHNDKYFEPQYQQRTVFTMVRIINDMAHRQHLCHKGLPQAALGKTTYVTRFGAGPTLGANFR